MLAPLWAMALAFAALVPVFVAVYRAAGDEFRERAGTAVRAAGLLAVIGGAVGFAQRAYASPGTGGAWAWVLAAAHFAVLLFVVLRGTFVIRAFVASPPPAFAFLSAADIRFLARRPRAWARGRAFFALSAVIVVAIGVVETSRWSDAATMGVALVFFDSLGRVAAPVLAFLGRVIGLLPIAFGFLAQRVDPVTWSVAQLRVAEREGEVSRFLVDDLIGILQPRIRKTAPGSRRYVPLVVRLQEAFMLRHRLTGSRADIDEAIRLGHSVMDSPAGRDGPLRLAVRMQLSSALHQGYLRTGDLQMLDEATRLQREVLAEPSLHPALVSPGKSNLSALLNDRFAADEDVAVLREAVALQREAIEQTPTQDFRSTLRAAGKVMLSPRAGRVARRAAGARTEDSRVNAHNLPTRLVNLGGSLTFLHGVDDDPGILAEAVTVLRRGISLMPPDHTMRPWALSQLADTLLVSHSQGTATPREAEALLREAVGVTREAVAALPGGHPQAVLLTWLLGVASHRRYAASGDDADRREAIGHWRRASAAAEGLPGFRAIAARDWGHAAAQVQDWADAVEGYSAAIELLAFLPGRFMGRADQERALRGATEAVGDAAAAAIAAGNPGRAVELLELGRGILISQALDSRSDLGQLRVQHPELAASFVQVRDALARPAQEPGEEMVAMVVRRHELAREWDALLTRIRSLDGFGAFLRPRSAAELARVAAAGPIVMLNISNYRCDALILRDGGVTVVALPEVSEEAVAQRLTDYFTALAASVSADRSLLERKQGESGVRDVLAWLWDAVAAPVLACLPEGTPRLWWVPTGALTLLPIHAAGRDGSQTVLDTVVSSYTPTIRALENAREQGATAPRGEALIVSVAAPTGARPLRAVAAEVQAVAEHISPVRELKEEEATRERVLAGLADAPIAHFACHAYTDMTDASASRLILHDEALSITDVNTLRITGGHLAFLSACTTALGNADLINEAIHLASAFQLAGYAHVIGTLWPAADNAAAAVTAEFYKRLAEGRPVSAALHGAVLSLRAGARRTPSLWAPYIHVGP